MLKKIIIRYLLTKIHTNEINVNDKLPSENQLKIKFNCNVHTAASALKKLSEKRLVKYKPGVGYLLVKNIHDDVDISAYVSYSKVTKKEFILEKFPINLLSNFKFSNYVSKIVNNYYFNDVHNATQYFFLTKKAASLIGDDSLDHNNWLQVMIKNKIVPLSLKKQVSFINNDQAHLSIKDDFIVVLKLILRDDSNREIAIVYNFLSNKYFMAKKETISI